MRIPRQHVEIVLGGDHAYWSDDDGSYDAVLIEDNVVLNIDPPTGCPCAIHGQPDTKYIPVADFTAMAT